MSDGIQILLVAVVSGGVGAVVGYYLYWVEKLKTEVRRLDSVKASERWTESRIEMIKDRLSVSDGIVFPAIGEFKTRLAELEK